MNESDTVESREGVDSMDIDLARGERGNANLKELNKFPVFVLSSVDLFEEFEDVEDPALPADVPRNNENAGAVRGCADGRDPPQWCASGEMTISSTSNSSSSSSVELALLVDIEGREEFEDDDSSSSIASSQLDIEPMPWVSN